MPTSPALKAAAETEIAVLNVQFENLAEKVGDIRTDIKALSDSIQTSTKATNDSIKSLQTATTKAHGELSVKISRLEKWKWMLMGAGTTVGIIGGFLAHPVVQRIIGL